MKEIVTSISFGRLISLLTFPGVIIHEWAHKFFCNRAHVPVYKTCYFRLGSPAGYVVHGPADSYWKAFLISISPFIVNTLLAFLVYLVAFNIPLGVTTYLLCWLGISLAMHSFPSSADADSLWIYTRTAWKRNPLVLFGFPVAGLVRLAAMLNVIWFDLLYAVFLLLLVAFLVGGGVLF